MAGLTTELVNTIEKQNKIYEELIEIGLKKKLIIVENNIEKLQELLSIENELVGKSTKLDKKREKIFKDIAFVLNKPLPLTLSQIIELIKGQPEAGILSSHREVSLERLEKLKKINDQNRDLISVSLDQIDFSMNYIRGSVSKTPYYYDSAGNEINVDDKKLFDATQ